jgi:predicted nuclease of predicted toxin-antitoxin system
VAKARPARVGLDEDVRPLVGRLLAERGWDVVSVVGLGRTGIADERQLEWATHEGRVLVSHNVADFARLAAVWSRDGKCHGGMILLRQGTLAWVLRDLLELLVRHPNAEEWIDQVRWGTARRPRG